MKARWWIGVGVVVTVFVVISLGVGWLWWERSMWRQKTMAASLTADSTFFDDCGSDDYGWRNSGRSDYGRMGPGMMGDARSAPDAVACDETLGVAVAACDETRVAPEVSNAERWGRKGRDTKKQGRGP